MNSVKTPGEQIIESTALPTFIFINIGVLYWILVTMQKVAPAFEGENFMLSVTAMLIQEKTPLWWGYFLLIPFILSFAWLIRKVRVRFKLFLPNETFEKHHAVDVALALAFINIILGLGLLAIT